MMSLSQAQSVHSSQLSFSPVPVIKQQGHNDVFSSTLSRERDSTLKDKPRIRCENRSPEILEHVRNVFPQDNTLPSNGVLTSRQVHKVLFPEPTADYRRDKLSFETEKNVLSACALLSAAPVIFA
jgi:hypothetical protein